MNHDEILDARTWSSIGALAKRKNPRLAPGVVGEASGLGEETEAQLKTTTVLALLASAGPVLPERSLLVRPPEFQPVRQQE